MIPNSTRESPFLSVTHNPVDWWQCKSRLGLKLPRCAHSANVQVKEGKKPKFELGVAEAKLGNAISDGLGVPCACNEFTGELLRGVRAHAGHLTKVHILDCECMEVHLFWVRRALRGR